MSAVVALYFLAKNIEEKYWTATFSTAAFGFARYVYTGNPASLKFSGRMASFGIRAHTNAVLGVLRTPLIRGGTTTIGGAALRGAAAVGAGYVIGATIGTAASQLMFGDRGSELALDLYLPGGVSFIDKGLLDMPSNAWAIATHYAERVNESNVWDNFYV